MRIERQVGDERAATLGPVSVLRSTVLGLVCALGCHADTTGPAEHTSPDLETVPYAQLGPGKVAFHRDWGGGGRSAVYIVDGKTNSSLHILDNKIGYDPSLSPDGRRIAYTDLITLPNFAAVYYEVFLANIDGSAAQQVTHFRALAGPPTWSSDGTRIVMLVSGPPFANAFAQTPSPNATDVKQLTSFELASDHTFQCPVLLDHRQRVSLSPTGAVVFACDHVAGEIDVQVPGSPAVARHRELNDGGLSRIVIDPTWSPDGARIAFIVETASTTQLVGFAVKVMSADGAMVRTVVDVPMAWTGGNPRLGAGPSLCWMPDLSRLVFTMPISASTAHVWSVKPDGSELTELTSAPGVWDSAVSCSQ